MSEDGTPEDKKRKQIQETVVDIFKTDRIKKYANLSFEKVLDHLEIDDKVIEHICENLIALTKSYGSANQGNESKRQKFVSTVIHYIIAQYYGKSVMIKKEKQIDSEDIKEPIEF